MNKKKALLGIFICGLILCISKDHCIMPVLAQENKSELSEVTRALIGQGWFYSSSWDQSGSTLAVSSSTGTWLYEIDNLTHPTLIPSAGGYEVLRSVFSPQGSVLITSGGYLAEGSLAPVDMIDIPSGKTLFNIGSYPEDITALAISPDGKSLLFGLVSGTVYLWDIEAKKEVWSEEIYLNHVTGLAFSPDGHTFATAGSEGVIIFNSPNRTDLKPILTKGFRVETLVFAADGKSLFGGTYALEPAYTNDIIQWDVASGAEIARFSGHNLAVKDLDISQTGETLVSGSFDQTIRLWDIKSGENTQIWQTDTIIFDVKFNPDNNRISSIGHYLRASTALGGAISAEDLLLGGRAIPYVYSKLTLWDVTTGKEVFSQTSSPFEDVINDLDYSPHNPNLALAGVTGKIYLYDPVSEVLQTLTGHSEWATKVQFNESGDLLASGSDDGTVRLWDARTGRLVKILTGNQGSIFSLAFTSSSKYLVAGDILGFIMCWNIETGEIFKQYKSPDIYPSILDIIPTSEENTIILSNNSGTVMVLNIVSDDSEVLNIGATSGVFSLDLSANNLLVAASRDGFVRVWDLSNQRMVREIPVDLSENARFLDEQHLVILNVLTQEISVVDLENAITMSKISLSTQVNSFVIETTNRQIISAQKDGTLAIYNLK